MEGSAICFSISSSCVRALAGSKIVSQIADFVAKRDVLLLEFFDHNYALTGWILRENTTLIVIIAHTNVHIHANQSPWRV
jgi:hypothetical protein